MLLIFATGIGATAQNAKFQLPVSGGSIYSPCRFNLTTCATSSYHTGIDIHSTGNDDILASNVGKIVAIIQNGSSDHNMGNTIVIEHKIQNAQGGVETLYSQYSHLSSFMPGIYVQQVVTKGQKIGVMGGSGNGSPNYWGKHLHFEIKRSNTIGSNPSGYWGYTPTSAVNYNYIDPEYIMTSNTTGIGNDYAYWEFSGNGNLEGWSLINLAGWSVSGGTLFYDPSGTDPNIKSPELFVDASVLKYLKFNMASNATDGNGKIYFKTDSENSYNENKTITFSVINNGQFYDYNINAYLHSKWIGKITGIRIDPANAGLSGTNADTIGWSWVRLSPNP